MSDKLSFSERKAAAKNAMRSLGFCDFTGSWSGRSLKLSGEIHGASKKAKATIDLQRHPVRTNVSVFVEVSADGHTDSEYQSAYIEKYASKSDVEAAINRLIERMRKSLRRMQNAVDCLSDEVAS